MIWADKIGLAWAVIVILFMLAMASGGGAPGAYNGHQLDAWAGIVEIVILPPWVILRVIDFLLGGPARRRGFVKVRFY